MSSDQSSYQGSKVHVLNSNVIELIFQKKALNLNIWLLKDASFSQIVVIFRKIRQQLGEKMVDEAVIPVRWVHRHFSWTICAHEELIFSTMFERSFVTWNSPNAQNSPKGTSFTKVHRVKKHGWCNFGILSNAPTGFLFTKIEEEKTETRKFVHILLPYQIPLLFYLWRILKMLKTCQMKNALFWRTWVNNPFSFFILIHSRVVLRLFFCFFKYRLPITSNSASYSQNWGEKLKWASFLTNPSDTSGNILVNCDRRLICSKQCNNCLASTATHNANCWQMVVTWAFIQVAGFETWWHEPSLVTLCSPHRISFVGQLWVVHELKRHSASIDVCCGSISL